MKFVKIGIGFLILALVVLIFLAPLGPVPGFFIGGTPAESPPVWSQTDSVHQIQLQVPGVLPRVVNLWVVEFQGELYVFGDRSSTWVSMIGDGGPIKLRLEGRTYSLSAVPVEVGWQPIYQAYLDKYTPDYPDLVGSFPSMDVAGETGQVFRLSRGS